MTTPDQYGMSMGSTAPHNGAYDVPGGAGGHLPEFSTGISGETDPNKTASVFNLNADSARYNAMVPRQFGPTSVLQTVVRNPGGNGMSAGQAARRWADGSPQGNPNGMAQSSFEKAVLLKMAGQDSGVE
jgi:hypothetical protein